MWRRAILEICCLETQVILQKVLGAMASVYFLFVCPPAAVAAAAI